MSAIPAKWIQGYVDQLLDVAGRIGPNTPMGLRMLERADIVMDLVEAWRTRDAKQADRASGRPSGRV